MGKLRRQRLILLSAAVGLLVLGLMMFFSATSPSLHQHLARRPLDGFRAILGPVRVFLTLGGGAAVLLVSSRLVSMEYGLGTIRVLLGRGTGRWQLLYAKLCAVGIVALLGLLLFALLAAAGTVLVVVHQTGSAALLRHLPPLAWGEVGLTLAGVLVSLTSCLLLGTAAASLVRSVAGGMLLAVVFFPVDNGLALLLPQLHHVTGSSYWSQASAFLYGPELNRLPLLFGLDRPGVAASLPLPAVPTTLLEGLAVIAGWWLLLLAISMASLARHDILA